jgi:hypothetical protein
VVLVVSTGAARSFLRVSADRLQYPESNLNVLPSQPGVSRAITDAPPKNLDVLRSRREQTGGDFPVLERDSTRLERNPTRLEGGTSDRGSTFGCDRGT